MWKCHHHRFGDEMTDRQVVMSVSYNEARTTRTGTTIQLCYTIFKCPSLLHHLQVYSFKDTKKYLIISPSNHFASTKVTVLQSKGEFITMVKLRPKEGKLIYLAYQCHYYFIFSSAPPSLTDSICFRLSCTYLQI